MEAYNIYYKNEKINKRPLSKEDVETIKKYPYISKRNPFTNQITEMEIKNLQFIKCIII